MTHEDIEATKAPLLDHLIELRSRLIKAIRPSVLPASDVFSSPSRSSTS